MYTLRKVLSVLLLLLIIPLITAQIALQTVRSMMVNPTAIKEAMRNAGLYTEAERTITRSILGSESDQAELPLPPERVARIWNQALPAQRLEQITEQVIDGVYAWVWGSTPEPTLVLDLTDIRLSVKAAVRTELTAELERLPTCSQQQLSQLKASAAKALPACKAPEKQVNTTVVDTIITNMDLDNVMPQQVNLAAEIAGEQGTGFWLEAWDGVKTLRLFLDLILWGWVVVTVLLLLLLLLNLDHWYTPLGWIGAATVLGSAPLAIAALGGTAVTSALTVQSATGNPESEFLGTVISVAVGTVGAAIRNLSLAVLLLGLSAMAGSIYGRLTDRPAPEANP